MPSPEPDDDLDFLFSSSPPAPPAPPETLRFLHHNLEASRQLNLPDAPSLHLAVTTVAERLLALPRRSSLPDEMAHIAALRVASGAVRERLPFECAAADFLARIEDATGPDLEASEVAYRTKRTNWLGQARAAIEAEGMDPGPDAGRWATRYGWDSSRG